MLQAWGEEGFFCWQFGLEFPERELFAGLLCTCALGYDPAGHTTCPGGYEGALPGGIEGWPERLQAYHKVRPGYSRLSSQGYGSEHQVSQMTSKLT